MAAYYDQMRGQAKDELFAALEHTAIAANLLDAINDMGEWDEIVTARVAIRNAILKMINKDLGRIKGASE